MSHWNRHPWLVLAWFVIVTIICAHGAIEAFRTGDDWGAAVFATAVLLGANQAQTAFIVAAGRAVAAET